MWWWWFFFSLLLGRFYCCVSSFLLPFFLSFSALGRFTLVSKSNTRKKKRGRIVGLLACLPASGNRNTQKRRGEKRRRECTVESYLLHTQEPSRVEAQAAAGRDGRRRKANSTRSNRGHTWPFFSFLFYFSFLLLFSYMCVCPSEGSRLTHTHGFCSLASVSVQSGLPLLYAVLH